MLPDCVWISTSIAKPNEIIPVREWLRDCTVLRLSAFCPEKNQYTRHTRISLCNLTKVNQDFHKHEVIALRSTSLPETRRQRTTAAWFVTDFTAVRVKMLGQRIWLHLHRSLLVQLIRRVARICFQRILIININFFSFSSCAAKRHWKWFIYIYMVVDGFCCWPNARRLFKMIQTLYTTFISSLLSLSIRSFISFVGFSAEQCLPFGQKFIHFVQNMCTYVCKRWPQYIAAVHRHPQWRRHAECYVRFIWWVEIRLGRHNLQSFGIYRLLNICSPPIIRCVDKIINGRYRNMISGPDYDGSKN